MADRFADPNERSIDLLDGGWGQGTFFTGVRVAVVDGVAHLLFYTEQPSASGGGSEFVVVSRLISPLARAKAALEDATGRLVYGATPDRSGRTVDAGMKH
jgi:hypothetical protein